ncbi:hypothetical protein [Lysobacter sp. Root690]|uniref:hypothetical protein n=1 Tax=Lysobacter sp. Root690 TaxID=1736588 RepID=UPI0012F9087E|nr:hypothetical protein [Lysobacter sp. Root690]
MPQKPTSAALDATSFDTKVNPEADGLFPVAIVLSLEPVDPEKHPMIEVQRTTNRIVERDHSRRHAFCQRFAWGSAKKTFGFYFNDVYSAAM